MSEEDEAEVSSYNRERGQILEVRCKHKSAWMFLPCLAGSAGEQHHRLVVGVV
jgi:hypothetical protein